MNDPKFLVVRNRSGAMQGQPVPSGPFVISLAYEGLEFSVFRAILEAFQPVGVLDLRASASFRDGGFTAERTFNFFATKQVEYGRLDEDGEAACFPRQVLMLAQSWLRRGPIVVLGAARMYEGSERERFVCSLAMERPLKVLMHERFSQQKWLMLEMEVAARVAMATTRAREHREEPSLHPPTQLMLPLGIGGQDAPKPRKRRRQGPESGT
jgi:hypothetical protein